MPITPEDFDPLGNARARLFVDVIDAVVDDNLYRTVATVFAPADGLVLTTGFVTAPPFPVMERQSLLITVANQGAGAVNVEYRFTGYDLNGNLVSELVSLNQTGAATKSKVLETIFIAITQVKVERIISGTPGAAATMLIGHGGGDTNNGTGRPRFPISSKIPKIDFGGGIFSTTGGLAQILGIFREATMGGTMLGVTVDTQKKNFSYDTNVLTAGKLVVVYKPEYSGQL